MTPHIQTRQGLNIFINGEMFEVPNEHKEFNDIALLARSDDPNAGDTIRSILTRVVTAVKNAVNAAPNSGVTFDDGVVRYNGEELHNTLTERMVRMVEEGFPVDPLVRFLENLMQNPSFRVVNNLYDFLEYGKIPITEDGHFLAYKAIREDWHDIRTGTMDNSIGKVVSIPRNKVDENPNNTCSYGLHVCSWDYLPHFAHANGRVVIVKVNPANVVAIPADYNNTKMRCSEYEVVSEYADYYTKDPHNLLASKSVFANSLFSGCSSSEPDTEYDVWEEEEDSEYEYPRFF